jgi:hypothetical protein
VCGCPLTQLQQCDRQQSSAADEYCEVDGRLGRHCSRLSWGGAMQLHLRLRLHLPLRLLLGGCTREQLPRPRAFLLHLHLLLLLPLLCIRGGLRGCGGRRRGAVHALRDLGLGVRLQPAAVAGVQRRVSGRRHRTLVKRLAVFMQFQ